MQKSLRILLIQLKMSKQQSKKIALVTGASRGFGFAAARLLAQQDFHIIAIGQTVGGLEELDDIIKKSGGSTSLAVIDISDTESLKEMFISVGKRWSTINLIIHAAIHSPALTPVLHIDSRDLQHALKVNVYATEALISLTSSLLTHSSVFVFLNDSFAKHKFAGAYGKTKLAQIELANSWQKKCTSNDPIVKIFEPQPMYTNTRRRFYPGTIKAMLSTPIIEAKRLLSELGYGCD